VPTSAIITPKHGPIILSHTPHRNSPTYGIIEDYFR
jgi:hypothetical protein